MLYRFFSDLHLEKDAAQVKAPSVADLWRPEPLPTDADTVLILAGDLWNKRRPLEFAGQSWLARVAAGYKAVVVVLGNHDYWGANLHTLPTQWRQHMQLQGLANVHLLEMAEGAALGSVVLDGVRFIGGTLWTDMHKGDPLVVTKYDHEKGMDGRALWNDRNFIRATPEYHRFTAHHWLARYQQSLAGLRAALTEGAEPVILVTHCAPCLVSAPPRDNDPLASYLYASDLSDLILDHPRIKLAVHGHTHEKLDYLMGDVRVRCNPRGYAPGLLVDGFDPVSLYEFS